MLLIATALTLALQAAAATAPLEPVQPLGPVQAVQAVQGGQVVAPALRADTDTVVYHPRPRPMASTHSDAYYSRLKVHRWLSYIELPVFGAEYVLGQKLINNPTDGVRHAHQAVAGALGALFVVNTVTGVWNLVEGWDDMPQRKLVVTHSVLMLAADAGFVATGVLASNAKHSVSGRNQHRDVAIASMSVATVSTAIMWFRRK